MCVHQLPNYVNKIVFPLVSIQLQLQVKLQILHHSLVLHVEAMLYLVYHQL